MRYEETIVLMAASIHGGQIASGDGAAAGNRRWALEEAKRLYQAAVEMNLAGEKGHE